MKRRNFLKKLPIAASIPFAVGGIPLRLMAENPLTQVLRTNGNGDKVLIILQMHGGNDGLNCLIPVENYEGYYKARPNIAIPAKNSIRSYIPLDSTLPSNVQVGLHPDMSAMKAMYDQGKVNIVQGVSYKNNNGSHFRGRDIWFMGGGSDDYFDSGWLGRYLQNQYVIPPKTYPADFPNEDMPHPLALEMGSDVSLIFHQKGSIPASIYIDDPESFAKMIDELEGFQDNIDEKGIPPVALTDSAYWKELTQWILKTEDTSKKYAQKLLEVYQKSTDTSVTYPEKYPFNAPQGSATNHLSAQLKLIARLLAGGIKTRVFMVKIGGFDTHAGQVESYDPTMGAHAALMYHISSAMKAFQDDLKLRGLDENVLTVTTSEFGRRIKSNGSFGTDHGTGGPIFIFGRGARPGVIGEVPNLAKDNIEMQYDYRQIYANILLDWMGVPKDVLASTIFGNQKPPLELRDFIDGPRVDGLTGNYEPLPLATQEITGVEEFVGSRFSLEDCYPNPAKEKTTIFFKVNAASQVTVNLVDQQGKEIRTLINKHYEPGQHRVEVDLNGIGTGHYIYQMKTLFYKQSKKLAIIK
jgi:uncharacterized protein (DUF1501 family)